MMIVSPAFKLIHTDCIIVVLTRLKHNYITQTPQIRCPPLSLIIKSQLELETYF